MGPFLLQEIFIMSDQFIENDMIIILITTIKPLNKGFTFYFKKRHFFIIRFCSISKE